MTQQSARRRRSPETQPHDLLNNNQLVSAKARISPKLSMVSRKSSPSSNNSIYFKLFVAKVQLDQKQNPVLGISVIPNSE